MDRLCVWTKGMKTTALRSWGYDIHDIHDTLYNPVPDGGAWTVIPRFTF